MNRKECLESIGMIIPEHCFRIQILPGPSFTSIDDIRGWKFNVNLVESAEFKEGGGFTHKPYVSADIFRETSNSALIMKEDVFIRETAYRSYGQFRSSSVAKEWSVSRSQCLCASAPHAHACLAHRSAGCVDRCVVCCALLAAGPRTRGKLRSTRSS